MFLRPLIRYDAANMLRSAVGSRGIAEKDVEKLQKKLDEAKAGLLEDWKLGQQGWLGCPDDSSIIAKIEKLAKEKRHFKTCLVIGIGGSDLGARAAWHALKHEARGMRLEFLGGNTDPDEIEWTLKNLDLKTTLINVISKSGDTIEPMSVFVLVRDRLIKAVGHDAHAKHIVATTDEHHGALRDLAFHSDYATLPIPKNIGGRFSVLTAVGLFPLACAGLNIRSMMSGARNIRNAFVKQSPQENISTTYAAIHVLGDKAGKPIHVLMPYSERLRLFGQWYRQIWAESLGKEGKGPTPVAALGATDQHSQIQLYVDGPADKLVTFIEVDSFASKVVLPKSARTIPALSHLAGKSFSDILHAERKATAIGLQRAKRPNGTLFIPRVNEETLGALFMFFQIATGIAGELYGIDTYTQPGVEGGKRAMKEVF